jgi:hypothetical protein
VADVQQRDPRRKKSGKFPTMTLGGLTASDLPIALRQSPVLRFNDDALSRLLNYVGAGRLAAAVIDRVVHHARIVKTNGPASA